VEPFETLAKRVKGALAEDEDSGSLLRGSELLDDHPEWRTFHEVSLFLQVKIGKW